MLKTHFTYVFLFLQTVVLGDHIDAIVKTPDLLGSYTGSSAMSNTLWKSVGYPHGAYPKCNIVSLSGGQTREMAIGVIYTGDTTNSNRRGITDITLICRKYNHGPIFPFGSLPSTHTYNTFWSYNQANWDREGNKETKTLTCTDNHHLTGFKFKYDKCSRRKGAICRGIMQISIICSNGDRKDSTSYDSGVPTDRIEYHTHNEFGNDIGVCGLDLFGKETQGVMGLGIKYCGRPSCPVFQKDDGKIYTMRNPDQDTFNCIWDNECSDDEKNICKDPNSWCSEEVFVEGYKCLCNAGYIPNHVSDCTRKNCDTLTCTAVPCSYPSSFGLSIPSVDGCKCSSGYKRKIGKQVDVSGTVDANGGYHTNNCENINECDTVHRPLQCPDGTCTDYTPTQCDEGVCVDRFECRCDRPETETIIRCIGSPIQGFECKQGYFYDSVDILDPSKGPDHEHLCWTCQDEYGVDRPDCGGNGHCINSFQLDTFIRRVTMDTRVLRV